MKTCAHHVTGCTPKGTSAQLSRSGKCFVGRRVRRGGRIEYGREVSDGGLSAAYLEF